MSQAAENLRDIVSLARLLRRMADRHAQDRIHDEFLSVAAELEDRAHFFAADYLPDAKREDALHVPVNLVI